MDKFTITVVDNETKKSTTTSGNIILVAIGTKDKNDIIQMSNQHIAGNYPDICRIIIGLSSQIHKAFIPNKKEALEEDDTK